MFVPRGGYYGEPYYGGDYSEQDGGYEYPVRGGNRGFRGGRGRGRRRGEVTKNETFVFLMISDI